MALINNSVHYNPKIVTDGLVLCLDAANSKSYPRNGTTWFDLSGNSNHIDLINGTTFNSANNGVMVFDGTNDGARSFNNLNLSNTNAVTIFCFMKVNSFATTQVLYELGTNYNNDNDAFLISFDNTGMGASIKGNVGYNIASYDLSLMGDLQWCSVCGIHDKSQSSKENLLYRNALEIGELSNPLSPYTANNTNNFGNRIFHIGARNRNAFFASINLSCFMLYNRRLNIFEIKQNFNALRGRFNL
jgi:hypothetical protein